MPAERRIFSIPSGVPFLKTLAAALCDGRLNEEFRYDPADPLSLADVTIFVPTRRSARVLAGQEAPRSRAHHAYIGLEALKLAALVALGATLLAG